ncbi:hypothetical protein ACVR0S_08850 [Streptococcus dentapri]|uniref:Uncharacterized protein n=1 Tax=Streptococcus dentapri TaxID=573564 RepID=A0ABV8D367_9STRE
MLSRMGKIIKKLNKVSLDIEFYTNFCNLLIISNDLKYFYHKDLENTSVGNLLNNISYTLVQRIDVDSLLKFYPMYVKEHIHFFIYARKFGLDIQILDNYFSSDIIRKNEWETHQYDYLVNQINFMKGLSLYKLDTTQVNMFQNHDMTIENLLNDGIIDASLSNYLVMTSMDEGFKNENLVFSEIKQLLLEDAKDV